MKNFRSFGLVASIVISFLYALCFGGVREAEAAEFGNSFNFGGFDGGFYGRDVSDPDDDLGSGISFNVNSGVHRIDQVYTHFTTLSEDSSEVYGHIFVSGTKNASLNEHDTFSSLGMTVGDVYLYQGTSLRVFLDHNDVPFNSGHASIRVAPMDLFGVVMNYQEHSWEEEPNITRFYFDVNFFGSFGPGAEGDRLGAPFVPAPGTAGLVFASVCMFRRRRQMA